MKHIKYIQGIANIQRLIKYIYRNEQCCVVYVCTMSLLISTSIIIILIES